MTERARNQVVGPNAGNLVQADSISGGVNFYGSAPPRESGGDQQRLFTALLDMTFAITVQDQPRTAFTVAPHRMVTLGDKQPVLLNTDCYSHPSIARSVEPGDELWALGFPQGNESRPEVVELQNSTMMHEHSVAHPLDFRRGKTGVGSTGGPVINRRTGAVCGLLVIADDGFFLVPAVEIEKIVLKIPNARAWLELLDDNQLRAGGQRYPGKRLRTYLSDVSQIGEEHPYHPLVQQGPSLTEFYVPQHLHHETDGTQRIKVDALVQRHHGAQVLGDPGVGKSSLVRHLAAESARRWLADGTGEFVPVPVAAQSLVNSGSSLPRLLAEGIMGEVTTVLDSPALIEMFEREPMPDVAWLVLIDGLDEVLNDYDRQMVLNRVLHQRGRSAYRFVITSRPLGSGAFNKLSKHAKFPTYVVEPFSDTELAEFARAWFLDAGHRDAQEMADTFMAEVSRSGLGRLARVPLVSMMLCLLFAVNRDARLPRSQFDVYEQFFSVLKQKLEMSATRQQLAARVATFGGHAADAVAQLVTGLPELLTDSNLTAASLITASLVKASLHGADLTDADLTQADLTNASVPNAILTNINLTMAKLINVYGLPPELKQR